jgi:predicted porin
MKAMTIALTGLLALSACSQPQVPAGQRNEAASLPPSFNFSKLGLRALASSVNRRQATMATLYGNDLARQAALGGTGAAQPGEVLALLTWQQRADPNWFGARIPGALQSLELLRTRNAGAGQLAVNYQCFTGKNLTLRADTVHQHERITYLLAQKPAVLP